MSLTSKGWIMNTPEQSKNDLHNKALAEIPNFQDLPTELQNNLLDESVIVDQMLEQKISDMFNGFSPDFANDFMFEQLANTFGLFRKKEVTSSVVVTFTGTNGTVIPENTKVTNADGSIIVYTQKEVVINATSVDVYCRAETYNGVINENTMTVCPAINFENLTNKAKGITGVKAETLEQFKERVFIATRGAKQGSVNRFYNLVSRIDGVIPRTIKANQVEFTQTGINYVGVECIVSGGDNIEVANAIFNSFLETSKLIAVAVSGTAVTQNLQLYNSIYAIRFIRPAEKQIRVDVTFSLSTAYYAVTVTNQITDGVTEYINSIPVGEPIYQNKMISIVFEKLNEIDIIPNYITGLNIEVKKKTGTTTYDTLQWQNEKITLNKDEYLVAEIVGVSIQ